MCCRRKPQLQQRESDKTDEIESVLCGKVEGLLQAFRQSRENNIYCFYALAASHGGWRILTYMMFVCCHTSRDIPLYLLVRECNVEEYLAIDCKISQFFYTNLTCKFVVFSFLRLLLGSHYTNQNTNIHNKCYRVYRKLGLS